MPAGRPAKPGVISYHVKLPKELIDKLDALAEKESRSRSELLADGAGLYLRRAARTKTAKPAKSK